MYIYIYKYTYITHLAALSSLSLSSAYNVHTQPPLKAPETRGGTIQTLTGTHPLALARLERRLGGGGGAGRSEDSDGCSTTTVMTAAR